MNYASPSLVIIVDRRPRFLGNQLRRSLITLPLAGKNLLMYWVEAFQQQLPHAGISVVPTFEHDAGYIEDVESMCPGVEVVEKSKLHENLSHLEPCDWVLLVDSARPPARLFDATGLLCRLMPSTQTTHLVLSRSATGESDEQVILDGKNRVQRIQRAYAGITKLEGAGVFASYVQVCALRSLNGTLDAVPGNLRHALAIGGVPQTDIAASAGAFDLNQVSEFLRLNRQMMHGTCWLGTGGNTAGEAASSVACGTDVVIDQTARLYGPIVVGHRTRIDADVVIVGPAVIGKDVRIGKGALVSGGIIDDHAIIGGGKVVREQIVTGSLIENHDDESSKPNPDTTRGDDPSGAGRVRTNGEARNGPVARRETRLGLKRCCDALAAAAGLFALSPLLAIVAAMVKLTSNGPVLFGHVREGKGGREFRCLKFRTMVPDALARQRELSGESDVDGPQFKLIRDPRITWFGRMLRATNIDELPQLFNVLRGEMSLVGPRPSPFRENQICVPWRQARLSVRPGITGLWQVCRHERSSGDFHQWIHFDMLYVQHWSLRLDLQILFATILTLGGRFGMPVGWLIASEKLVERRRSAANTSLQMRWSEASLERWSEVCDALSVSDQKDESAGSRERGTGNITVVDSPKARAPRRSNSPATVIPARQVAQQQVRGNV